MNQQPTPLPWTTQMDAARRGLITLQMLEAAEREGLAPEIIRDRIAAGTVCLPANRNHSMLKGCAIGEGLTTKVNANLGISPTMPL